MKYKLLLIALLIIILPGVNGCMRNDIALEEKNKETQARMLSYAEKKFGGGFEVVEFVPAKSGFNDSLNENVLVLNRAGTDMVVNIREKLAEPYEYYDDYISALASYMGRDFIAFGAVPDLRHAKIYIAVKQDRVSCQDDLGEELLNPENVIDITAVINISARPNEEIVKGLYDIYQQLQKQKYKDFFMTVGFTDVNSDYGKYVNNYLLNGYKKWTDVGKNVYASLSVYDRNLTLEEFRDKIK